MLAHPTPNHRTTPRRASLSSLVRMMNNRLGCNEITPPLALLSPTGPISCDNVEQNFIYRSNKHFSSSWTDMNMSQLWVMKRRKLNFSHLVFPLLLLASSSSILSEERRNYREQSLPQISDWENLITPKTDIQRLSGRVTNLE